jgi:thymidylate synthase
MNEIEAENVPQAYVETIVKMHYWGREETSRNGQVITSPNPVMLTIRKPMERVLTDPVRDANPFFHVMEFVWMMAGSNDVKWIEQFNKRFREYADLGTDSIHGAYGFRWRVHFDVDQIRAVADHLKESRNSRQCVMAMWDPRVDLVGRHRDIPCNTQIMFRYDEQRTALDMTVINRSNDLIWGMLGANAVHMTYLHELISHMAGLNMGWYKVFTNNLHIYTEMPKFKEIWTTLVPHDTYNFRWAHPLMHSGETYEDLAADCTDLIHDDMPCRTLWMRDVAYPMYEVYINRRMGKTSWKEDIRKIKAIDWRTACEQWLERREKK